MTDQATEHRHAADEPPTEQPRRLTKGFWPVAAATACIGVAQLVLSWDELHRDISTDESFTFFAVGQDLGALINGCLADPTMSLYYAVTFVFTRLNPDSLLLMRLLTFAAYLGAVAVMLWSARRHRRLVHGALFVVALGITPVMREAVVDARAPVLAGLFAIIVAAVVARAAAAGAAASCTVPAVLVAALAFTHPSTVGAAGVAWLALAISPRRHGNKLLLGAVLLALLAAFGSNLLQADSTEGLVEEGVDGIVTALGHLWGGNALIASITIVVIAVAALPQIRSRARTWESPLAASMSVAWMSATLASAPMLALFYSRYLVVSLMLLCFAAATAEVKRRGADIGLLMVGVAAIVVGLTNLDRRPGDVPPWCKVAEHIQATAKAGDAVVFPYGSTTTPIAACLGDSDSQRLLSTVRFVPALRPADLARPREVWSHTLTNALVTELLTIRSGSVLVVRTPGAQPQLARVMNGLAAAGATCADDTVESFVVTTCSFG
jgi:hypothetical protein